MYIDETGAVSEGSVDIQVSGMSRTITVPQSEKLSAFVTVGYNSDQPGPIEIEIVTPPLDGATAISKAPRVVGERVIAEFDEIYYKGKRHPVTALMINPESLRPGYVDDVDHHYFARWAPFLLAAFAGGYAETLKTGTSTINTDGSTVNENNGIPDSDDQIRYALGKGLDRALPILEQQIDRPSTLTINNFSQVGVWFLEDAQMEVSK